MIGSTYHRLSTDMSVIQLVCNVNKLAGTCGEQDILYTDCDGIKEGEAFSTTHKNG